MNTSLTRNTRNCSIDIFRVIFAIFVVAIHSVPVTLDAFPLLSLTYSSLFRFAVPFFLAVSGYYFFKQSASYDLWRSLKKMMIVYMLWSGIYFVVNFITWGHLSPIVFAVECVYSFLLTGSYYHLWYFPALIFAICVSALFCKLKLRKALFCISILADFLCYLFSEFGLPSFIPESWSALMLKALSLLNMPIQGLFYFCCGQLLNFFYHKLQFSNAGRRLTVICPVSVILWFALIWSDYCFTLHADYLIRIGLYLNVGLLILVLLLNPLSYCRTIAKKCRYIANFTYYSHPLFLLGLKWVGVHWFHFSGWWYFPATVLTVISVGMILYRVNNKYINKLVG